MTIDAIVLLFVLLKAGASQRKPPVGCGSMSPSQKLEGALGLWDLRFEGVGFTGEVLGCVDSKLRV